MASVKTVVLVCDRCDRDESAQRRVRAHTVAVDKGAITEVEACDKCWGEVMGPVRELMLKGRKVPRRARKRAV